MYICIQYTYIHIQYMYMYHSAIQQKLIQHWKLTILEENKFLKIKISEPRKGGSKEYE